jgi:hypothetical protein
MSIDCTYAKYDMYDITYITSHISRIGMSIAVDGKYLVHIEMYV